jgi:hypothetical protein
MMADQKPVGKARKTKGITAEQLKSVNKITSAVDSVFDQDRPPKPQNILRDLPDLSPLERKLQRLPENYSVESTGQKNIDIDISAGTQEDNEQDDDYHLRVADRLPSLDDAINRLIPSLPDYDQQAEAVAAFNSAARRVIAARLEPGLNAKIQAMPQETLDQKKAICDFVEKTLEPLGLAVKVPNTPGLPGKLKTHPGSWPKIGRFMFEAYIDGKRKQPAFSDSLPELELTDATPAITSETPWQDMVGPKSSRRGRKLS